MMWGKSHSIGRSLSIGLAASALIAASAMAADIPPPPVVVAPPPPPPIAAPAFDWSGPYVGFYGGAVFEGGLQFFIAGIQAGYNVIAGERILFGIEGRLGAAFEVAPFGAALETALSARVGAILGERALLYGEGGIWWIQGAPVLLWTAGGGLEFAVGNRASLFGEAKVVGDFNGLCCAFTVEGGFNFHPGN
jgi:outer membrane immunogenic protein